jgi:hypothetical protein
MSDTDWLSEQVRRAQPSAAQERVLERVRLGSRAGGALAGVRVLVGREPCSLCQQQAGKIFDPDFPPAVPVEHCTHVLGCRCTYTPVMLYEVDDWSLDARPKPAEYATTILSRLALAVRAHGAIAGVKLLSSPDMCAACQRLSGGVYSPDHAPRIPLADCTCEGGCRCVYLPAMAYDPG